jgi:ABC-2 type transport system ATP-binding protein
MQQSAVRSEDPAAEGLRSRVLSAHDLSKAYGRRPALRGLSFSLQRGRVLGLLGPNGAGKTTAIRILTTMIEPSSGHFFIDGIGSEHPDLIRARIGVLPESLAFHKHITGLECLTFYAQLYGQTAADARSIARELLEEVGLQQRARSLIGSYSRGMRQRLGIARALINDPVVVFLDEPTLGLDPRGQQELLALVRRIARERKASVILCSHFLSEAEEVCDEVVILSAGQVVAQGSVAEVIGRAQQGVTDGTAIRIRVPSPMVPKARQILEALPNVRRVNPTGEGADLLTAELVAADEGAASSDHGSGNDILDALIRADVQILSFETEVGRLQDVFLQLTEETIE